MRGTPTTILGSVVADVARVQHAVLLCAEIDKGGFHARKHILDLADIHVADERLFVGSTDVVLNKNGSFHHDYLGLVR